MSDYEDTASLIKERDELKEQLRQAFPTNWEAERKAHRLLMRDLEKENAELKSIIHRMTASQQMCVGAAGIGDFEELCGWIDNAKQQLAAFHAAMEREKKPDWQKWLKDLADSLETEWDPGKSSRAEAARQLRYMADSFTLKANFVPSELRIKELEKQLKEAVELMSKGRDIIGEVAAYGNCECNIPSGFTCVPCEAVFFGKEVDAFLASQKDAK